MALSNLLDSWDKEDKPESSSLLRRTLGDTAVSVAKGVANTGQAAVGLLDIPTLGYAGKALDYTGYNPEQTNQFLEELYTPEQQAANQEVQNANGFTETFGAAIANPSTIYHGLVESLPLMLGGQAIAKGAMSAIPQLGRLAAGAMGEGTVTAGSQAEQIRQQTGDKLLTPAQAALAAGSGALTGGITALSGGLANKFGAGDIDTAFLGGQGGTGSAVSRFLKGGLTEGALEEMPQSMQEQMASNLALDKPVMEGVGSAGAQGGLLGFAQGGVTGAVFGKNQQEPVNQATAPTPIPPPEPQGALSRAVSKAPQLGAQPLSLPNLPADEIITFGDGSQARSSEVLQHLTTTGYTPEQAQDVVSNLLTQSKKDTQATAKAQQQAKQQQREQDLNTYLNVLSGNQENQRIAEGLKTEFEQTTLPKLQEQQQQEALQREAENQARQAELARRQAQPIITDSDGKIARFSDVKNAQQHLEQQGLGNSHVAVRSYGDYVVARKDLTPAQRTEILKANGKPQTAPAQNPFLNSLQPEPTNEQSQNQATQEITATPTLPLTPQAANQATQKKQTRKPIDHENDNLLTAIRKLGGLNKASFDANGGDSKFVKQNGVNQLFRNDEGMSINDMQRALRDEGFLQDDGNDQQLNNLLHEPDVKERYSNARTNFDAVYADRLSEPEQPPVIGTQSVIAQSTEENLRKGLNQSLQKLKNTREALTDKADIESIDYYIANTSKIIELMNSGKSFDEANEIVHPKIDSSNNSIGGNLIRDTLLFADRETKKQLGINQGSTNANTRTDPQAPTSKTQATQEETKQPSTSKAKPEKKKQAKQSPSVNDDYDDTIPFSKNQNKTERPYTSKQSLIQAMRKALDGVFGQGWFSQLLATGKFKVVSRADVQAMGISPNAQAFYNPKDDTAYFIYDNIDQRTDLVKLMMHEVGVHSLRLGRNDKEFQKILDQLNDLIQNSKNPIIQRAVKAARDAKTKPELMNEEIAGYLVEFHPKLSISQEILAWFRSQLRKLGITKINEKDLVYMASQALRNAPSDLLFDDVARKDNTIRMARKEGYEGNSVSEAEEWIRAVEKGLDMSFEARMKRAEAMGYNTEDIFYNGSWEPITKQKKATYMENMFDGFFLSKNEGVAEGFGNVINKFIAREDFTIDGFYQDDTPYENIIELLKERYPDATDEQIEDVVYEAVVNDKDAFRLDENDVLEVTGAEDVGHAGWQFQNDRGWLAGKLGYDVIGMEDENGQSYFAPYGSKIRSINAAFDPDYADSPNLLASYAGQKANNSDLSEEKRQYKEVEAKYFNEDGTANTGAFSPENDDIRYSIRSTVTDFFTGEETRATTLDDIDAMLNTGRQPRRDTGLQFWKDKLVTTFVDATRPFERFISDNLPPELASAILSGSDRALGMKAAFEREAMNLFGRDISKAIKAIVKANPKFDYKTAKDLAGTWLSVRYAPIANDWLMQKDQQRVDDLIAQGAPQKEINKAKAEQAKRIAAINDPKIIDVTKQPSDAGLAGGYNNATAQHLKDKIEAEIDVALLEKLADHVYDMNEWKLKQDIKNGKISQDTADKFPKSRFYVPLTGDPRTDESLDDVFSVGSGVNQQADYSMGGHKKSLAKNGIDASFEQLEKSARYHGWKDFKDAIESAYNQLINDKLAQGKTQKEAEAEVWEENQIKRRAEDGFIGENDIVVRKDGKGMIYTINNQAAMEALRSVNNEDVPSILKPIAYLTRLQARLVTQFMPLFAPTNMIRDVAERSENIRTRKIQGFNGDMNQVANDSIKNAARLLMRIKPVMMGVLAENTPLAKLFPVDNANPDIQDLKRFLALGGSSTYGDILANDSKKLSEKLKATGTFSDNTMEAIHLWNNAFELISGFSIYQSLVKQGLDERKAATASLNLMNFRKRGKYMNPIRALYMFAQPIATGGHQLAKTLSTPRGLARFAAYTVASAFLYSLLRSGDDDDELGINKMDEQGNFTLYRNILIPMGDGKYFKVPVGFGMQQLAWAHGVNLIRMAAGSMTPAETAAESIALWTKAAAPIAPAETAVLKHPFIWATQTFTPQIAKPIVNSALDVNAFGSPLTNARYEKEDKAKALQGRRDTPGWYKMAAEELARSTNGKVDMYPEQIRELLRGYGAGVGNEMLKWTIENPAKEERGLKVVSPAIDRYVLQSNDDSLKQRLYYRKRDLMNELEVKQSVGKELTPEEQKLVELNNELKKMEGRARGKLSSARKAERLKQMAKANNLTKQADNIKQRYMDMALTARA